MKNAFRGGRDSYCGKIEVFGTPTTSLFPLEGGRLSSNLYGSLKPTSLGGLGGKRVVNKVDGKCQDSL